MLKRPFISLLLIVSMALAGITASWGQATSSTLRFDRYSWDFGKIKEVDGPVSYTFEFTNTGDNAIVIERVSVSCGCTSPSYPKEPVLPGKRGTIKITYDPEMRPGMFSKDVYVISNNGKNNDKLSVRGEVEPAPRTVEQDYPYRFGDGLRLNSLNVNFRYVGQGKPAVTKLGYANPSSKTQDVSFEIIPNDGIITIEPVRGICAGCRGEFTVKANVPVGKTYGTLAYKAIPVVGGQKVMPGISVTLIATDDMSAQRGGVGGAPSARLDPAYHNFGQVRKGAKPSYTFVLTNEGENELIIRKIEAQQAMTTDLKEGTKIAPGKTLNIKCTLDTSTAKGGTFTKIITLVLNDPARPSRTMRLAASVDSK